METLTAMIVNLPRRMLAVVTVATVVCVFGFGLMTVKAFGMISGGGSSRAAFCKASIALDAKWQNVDDLSPVSTATVRDSLKDLKKLAAKAPHDVKPDVDLVVKAEEQVLDGQAFSVDSNAVDAASTRISNYYDTHCSSTTSSFGN